MKNFTQINQILQQEEERKVKHRSHPLAEWLELAPEKKFSPASDDYRLIVEGQYGDFSKLSSYEQEKFTFLMKNESPLKETYIPTQKEIFFLENLNGKSKKAPLSPQLVTQIAATDWGLSSKNLDNLYDRGLLNLENGHVTVPSTRRSSTLTQAFTWMNSYSTLSPEEHQNLMIKQGIEEPHPRLQAILKEKVDPSLAKGFFPSLQSEAHKGPRPLKMTVHDYSLFFKVIQGKTLGFNEELRLNKLRSIGVHPESRQSLNFLKKDPKSFKLKAALTRERLQYYQEEYGIEEKTLHFINTFKQVSREQLHQMGVSDEILSRYVNGVKNPLIPSSKILDKHVLPTLRGPEIYYSIHHNGAVSGRAFLERTLKSKEIAVRPQQRQDLLYHDLRVVDAVLAVKKEYEGKGYKVLAVQNESSQFSREKKGKKNHERANGPSFMDAIMLVQNPHDLSQEAIAIEYGNYSLERMKSKVDSSTFDKAYVYSNTDHCQRFTKALGHYPNVVFSAL